MKTKRIITCALSAAIAFSALLVPQLSSVKAAATNRIVNGDFETGSIGNEYIYTYDKTKGDSVKVVNKDGSNKAYFSRNNEIGGPDGRFLNQKVTLEKGNYRLTFDADINYLTEKGTPNKPFCFAVANKLDNFVRALTGDCIENANVSVLNYSGNVAPTVKIYDNKKADSAFAVYYDSAAGNVSAKFAVDFKVENDRQDVYVSLGINEPTAEAYVDNLKLIKMDVQETGFINGDFETGNLEGYKYTYGDKNPESTDAIKVVEIEGNSKAYIPARTAGDSYDYARGRFLNQKVDLPAGSYRMSFDTDITFTGVSNSQPFIFTVATEEQFDNDLERALNSIDGATASVLSTASELNTPEIKNYGDLEGGAFAVKPVSADNHAGGKLAVDFSLETAQTVYVSIGINATTASAYIDNIELKKTSVEETATANTAKFTPAEKEGYFVPNGAVTDSTGNLLEKNSDGSFTVGSDSNLTVKYFLNPVKNNVSTFGVSFREADSAKDLQAGIQFGTYAEDVNGKEFYTLIIKSGNSNRFNMLTEDVQAKIVKAYISKYNSELTNPSKWAKVSDGHNSYSIKVVKQTKNMFSNGTKLEYAVRLIGDYSEDTNIYAAKGFNISDDTVSFADNFKTAAYSDFKAGE